MRRCITPLVADRRAADYDHSAITCCHEILPFYPFSALPTPPPQITLLPRCSLLAWQEHSPSCRTILCLSSTETITYSFSQCLFSIFVNDDKKAFTVPHSSRLICELKTQRCPVLKWHKRDKALNTYLRSRNEQKLCIVVYPKWLIESHWGLFCKVDLNKLDKLQPKQCKMREWMKNFENTLS